MNFILKILFTIVFFVIITPIGLLLRLFGVDYLDVKKKTGRTTYWVNK